MGWRAHLKLLEAHLLIVIDTESWYNFFMRRHSILIQRSDMQIV